MGLEPFGAASEAGFLMEEIREDASAEEAGEGEGEDLSGGCDVLEERFEFGFGGEPGAFRVEQGDFEAGDAAEAPAEVGEFVDEILIDGGLGAIAVGVVLVGSWYSAGSSPGRRAWLVVSPWDWAF